MADSDSERKAKRKKREMKRELYYIIIGVLLSLGVQSIYVWMQIVAPPLNSAFYLFFGFTLLLIVVFIVVWTLYADEAEAELDSLLYGHDPTGNAITTMP